MELREAIARVASGGGLVEDEAASVMEKIMQGQATPAQIGALLVALRMKHESVEEIAGLARGMREASLRLDLPGYELVDTCGTGGDNAGTFNISTTAAFVVAGCGLKVAKHGNRFASSRCGSADVLEQLGVRIDLAPDKVAHCITEVGIGFLFAQIHHQAMRHAIGPRREIGMRTVFNLLGPLTNPAGATHQVIGVFAPELTEVLAQALHRLGCRRAMVVHGMDGLDEISIGAPTKVCELNEGRITTYELNPADLGFEFASLDKVLGGDAPTNAAITRAILAGEQGPRRDIVVLNSAAAIYVAGGTSSLGEAVEKARYSLDTGLALAKLEALVELTGALGGEDDTKQNCAS